MKQVVLGDHNEHNFSLIGIGHLDLRYVPRDVRRVQLRRHHLLELPVILVPDRDKELGDAVL